MKDETGDERGLGRSLCPLFLVIDGKLSMALHDRGVKATSPPSCKPGHHSATREPTLLPSDYFRRSHASARAAVPLTPPPPFFSLWLLRGTRRSRPRRRLPDACFSNTLHVRGRRRRGMFGAGMSRKRGLESPCDDQVGVLLPSVLGSQAQQAVARRGADWTAAGSGVCEPRAHGSSVHMTNLHAVQVPSVSSARKRGRFRRSLLAGTSSPQASVGCWDALWKGESGRIFHGVPA